MRLRSTLPALGIALCTAVSGACAPGTTTAGESGSPGRVPANRIAVVVENTLVPPTPITVYSVETQGGYRQILGNVSPNSTARFTFSPSISAGTYRLMGRTTAGQELFSTPFTVTTGQTVQWDVALNAIRTP